MKKRQRVPARHAAELWTTFSQTLVCVTLLTLRVSSSCRDIPRQADQGDVTQAWSGFNGGTDDLDRGPAFALRDALLIKAAVHDYGFSTLHGDGDGSFQDVGE